MKMKHLKTFENFSDMGRFSEESEEITNNVENIEDTHEEEMTSGCCPVHSEYNEECPDCCMDDEDDEFEDDSVRNWGDQVIEKKKNPFEKFQKDKKEAKGKKEDKKKEEPKGKGLTAAQKKLPAGLQKAILAKKK